MNSRISDISDTIDGKTSRSICDAVGERLRQNLCPDAMPPHLQCLMDELRKRDSEDCPRN